EAWVPTGGIEVKGRGLMQTYLWSPPDAGVVEGEATSMVSLDWEATTSSTGNPHGWEQRWSQRQSQRPSHRIRKAQAQARAPGLTNLQTSHSCSCSFAQHPHTQGQPRSQFQSQSHLGRVSRRHGHSSCHVGANGSTLGGGDAAASATEAVVITNADPSRNMG
ncbi:hypothetical protein Vretifemale_16868, partial [Volvox reticuliferus]